MRGNLGIVCVATAMLGALPPVVASASPFCFETGPGYEKCLDSPSGDYFHPIYQGPQVPDGYIPWVPAPVSIPIIDAPAALPVGPSVGDGCIHAEVNSTTVGADGSGLRCTSLPGAWYQWQPDTGITQTDPAIAGQAAWSDCISSHTAEECRQIVDGSP